MTINVIGKIRKTMGWCPDGNVIKNKSKGHIPIENIMAIPAPEETTILWLSRLFGILNIPVAFIAIIDITGAFLTIPPDIPRTMEQWVGFLTAVSAIAGAAAGLTVRNHHSMGRKIINILISVFGIIIVFRASIQAIISIN